MDELLISIAAKKRLLDHLRPLWPKALANLEHYYDIQLTYTSNAIEGNTLSPVETTLVIEQGITVGGKPLRDHLEALDHCDASAMCANSRGMNTEVSPADYALRAKRTPTQLSYNWQSGIHGDGFHRRLFGF
jgi:Fic family protein